MTVSARHKDFSAAASAFARSDQQTGPYWAEVDGLRAIAVVSVFLFHLDASALPGGFVGVDIFFVISGFLITNIILKNIESGKLSLLRFYQRRIARIAPNAFLVLSATVAVGFLVYSSQDFSTVGSNVAAAALSALNIKLLFQGNYFDVASDARPLVHFWSLSVEEQFYFIFPLFLYFVSRLTRRVLEVVLLCFAASFIASVVMTPLAPVASFYLLPTRAWELLAGSILAILARRAPDFARQRADLYLLAGVALIFLSIVFIGEKGFPGWIAALPVAGSSFALAGICGSNRGGPIRMGLSHPVMTFIGKRSYSLYLWHWPIFSFVDYYFFLSSPVFCTALKVALSALCALFAYHYVENPMRSWLNAPQRLAPAFAAFAIAAATLVITGYVIRSNYYLSASPGDIAAGGVSIKSGGRNRVALIGDCQASMYGRDLAFLAGEIGFDLHVLSAPGKNELPGELSTLWPKVFEFIEGNKPDLVILAQAWTWKLDDGGADRLERFLEASSPAKIIILVEPPYPWPNPSRHSINAGASRVIFENELAVTKRAEVEKILRRFESNRVRVVDMADIFLNSDNSVKIIGEDGRLIYQDRFHLSDAGTALVRPRLERVLREVLR